MLRLYATGGLAAAYHPAPNLRNDDHRNNKQALQCVVRQHVLVVNPHAQSIHANTPKTKLGPTLKKSIQAGRFFAGRARTSGVIVRISDFQLANPALWHGQHQQTTGCQLWQWLWLGEGLGLTALSLPPAKVIATATQLNSATKYCS